MSTLPAAFFNTIVEGDCLERLKELPDACIDAVICDPPAGIAFMGKSWDTNKGGRQQWITWLTEIMLEVCRVTKPGGHALLWALPRTSHWTATALEDAGWEVRDILTHVYGSGFPKNLDVSKALDKLLGCEREKIRSRITPHSTLAKGFSQELDERPWLAKGRENGYHEHDGRDRKSVV